MLYFPTLISIIEVVLVTVPVLLTVAFVTVAERKTMASMQRRLGPNMAIKNNTLVKKYDSRIKYYKIKYTGKRHYSTSYKNNHRNYHNKRNSNVIFWSCVIFIFSLVIVTYLFTQSCIVIGILKSPLSFIGSFLFTLSLIFLYLDDFRLSDIRTIKYIQIFTFLFMPLYIIFYIYCIPYTFIWDIIHCVKDSDINLHGHVSLDKEAGKAIGQGISNIGTNIGLGATVAGVAGAVGKGISKSSIPPLQKAGVIVSSAVIGGGIHVLASTINRSHNTTSDIKSNAIGSSNNYIGPSNNASNFLDSLNNLSEFETLLYCINLFTDVALYLVLILCLQLFYKFFISDNPQLKFLDYIFPSTYNNKIKTLIHKIIKLNKDMSIMWTVFIIILIIICLGAISYTSLELTQNFEHYINLYLAGK